MTGLNEFDMLGDGSDQDQTVYKPALPEEYESGHWLVDVVVIALATVGAFALCNWLVEVLS